MSSLLWLVLRRMRSMRNYKMRKVFWDDPYQRARKKSRIRRWQRRYI